MSVGEVEGLESFIDVADAVALQVVGLGQQGPYVEGGLYAVVEQSVLGVQCRPRLPLVYR